MSGHGGGHGGGHHESGGSSEVIKTPDTSPLGWLFIIFIALAISAPLFANEAGRLL